MSEFKGTPGPWSAVQQYADALSVIDGDGFKVVTAERTAILIDWDKKGFEHWGDEGGSRNLSGEEQFSNANLIAAAPELLEALQGVMSVIEKSEHWWIEFPNHGGFDAIRIEESINKAIGMDNNPEKKQPIDLDHAPLIQVLGRGMRMEKPSAPVDEKEKPTATTIDSAQQNDRLVKVMRSLAFSFPDESYSDIEEAAKQTLAALGLA